MCVRVRVCVCVAYLLLDLLRGVVARVEQGLAGLVRSPEAVLVGVNLSLLPRTTTREHQEVLHTQMHSVKHKSTPGRRQNRHFNRHTLGTT